MKNKPRKKEGKAACGRNLWEEGAGEADPPCRPHGPRPHTHRPPSPVHFLHSLLTTFPLPAVAALSALRRSHHMLRRRGRRLHMALSWLLAVTTLATLLAAVRPAGAAWCIVRSGAYDRALQLVRTTCAGPRGRRLRAHRGQRPLLPPQHPRRARLLRLQLHLPAFPRRAGGMRLRRHRHRNAHRHRSVLPRLSPLLAARPSCLLPYLRGINPSPASPFSFCFCGRSHLGVRRPLSLLLCATRLC
jgi:hypothetical protein